MIRFTALAATLPAILIAASLGLAAPAFAEDNAPQPVKIEGKRMMPHKKGGMMTPEDLDKIEKMTAEERHAFFKERREKWEKMSEEERAAAKAKADAEASMKGKEREAARMKAEEENKARQAQIEKERAEARAKMAKAPTIDPKSATPEARMKAETEAAKEIEAKKLAEDKAKMAKAAAARVRGGGRRA